MYFFNHKISSQEEAKSFVVKAVLGQGETVHVEQLLVHKALFLYRCFNCEATKT